MARKRAKKRSEGEQLEQMVRLRRGLPVLDQFSNERSVACVFRVEDLTRTRSHFRFHLSAALGTADVGFDCRVVRRVPSFYEVQPRGQRGGVEFRRSGPESDRFVRALAQRFGVRKASARMVRSATFSGFVLRPGSPDLETEFVRLKLFGSDQPDADRDRYSESSFVLALANRLAVWHEKDTEYRHALLGALTE